MSSRTVFVFWDSSKNPHKNAKDYCECVQTAPAVKAGCIVAGDVPNGVGFELM